MRRLGISLFAIATLSSLGAIVYATAFGSTTLSAYVDKISKAKSMSVKLVVQKVGDAPVSYALDFGKPNLAKIDGPTTLIVADGKNITTYDKNKNTYITVPETDSALTNLLQTDEYKLLQPFFSGGASFDGARDGATSSNMTEVDVPLGAKTAKAFFSSDDSLLKKLMVTTVKADSNETHVLNVSSFSLSNSVSPDAFAFKAPDGSRELTAADLSSDKWYTDLEEAKKAAADSGRKVFVDFFATWCGPCKMLAATVFSTDEFKALGKDLVFCRIDVDQQPSIAKAYNIEAMPTQDILSADGTVLAQTVGYGGPQAFFDFVNKALHS